MSQWDDWLASLRSAGMLADLSTAPATRGLKWEEPIEIDGDWTGASLEGSVSASPDGGTLATFTITGPVVASGVSTFTASLSAAGTSALPTDTDANGKTELPCMFRLTPSGGDKDTLFGGIFIVVGQA